MNNNHIEEMADVIRNTWLPIMRGDAVVGETCIYSDDALRIAENLFYKGYSKRPHGKWKPETEYYDDEYSECNKRKVWACSICGRTEVTKQPYCNCGAEMEEN